MHHIIMTKCRRIACPREAGWSRNGRPRQWCCHRCHALDLNASRPATLRTAIARRAGQARALLRYLGKAKWTDDLRERPERAGQRWS